MKSTKISLWNEIKSRFRHYWYHLFKKSYIREALKKRKGTCKACGLCCHVKFFHLITCPYLTKDNKCSIYDKQPFTCRAYPFDAKDRYYGLIPDLECNCGYYWNNDAG